MKKLIYSVIIFSLLIVGCTMKTIKKETVVMTPKFRPGYVYVVDKFREVNVPWYAFDLMKDPDHLNITMLSPNVVLFFFDREGPNLVDPGQAFAIILDQYKSTVYFFQSTIKEDQRFFFYDDKQEPVEITKSEYRTRLDNILKLDKAGLL